MGLGAGVFDPLHFRGGEEREAQGGGGVFGSQTLAPTPGPSPEGEGKVPHVVAVDYGSKRNIFRLLVEAGARVTVVPATASFDDVMAHKPDGYFLSNGPGDPAATGEYAVPVIQAMLETKKPLFGICLGHQMLALAVGGKTQQDVPGPPRC